MFSDEIRFSFQSDLRQTANVREHQLHATIIGLHRYGGSGLLIWGKLYWAPEQGDEYRTYPCQALRSSSDNLILCYCPVVKRI
ncbi:hypothetical protein TNCV_2605071 [Trichonephila clavipes]|nr:hypothetical protein TNCV_2605071 [Trichonephila clavipes]